MAQLNLDTQYINKAQQENAQQATNNDTGDFPDIVDGEYILQIEKVEKKQNKNGNGYHLSCQLRILGPDFANRVVFDNFNLWHETNPDTVMYAYQALDKLCDAIGLQLSETTDDQFLINKTFIGYLKTKNGFTNVKAYKPYNNQPLKSNIKANLNDAKNLYNPNFPKSGYPEQPTTKKPGKPELPPLPNDDIPF